jgi:hypothetical protein
VIFDDLNPELARAANKPAPGEDRSITSRAQAGFEHLQKGTDDASAFGTSLNEKMIAGLAKRMASEVAPYGASVAFAFKRRRTDRGKNWSYCLIEFGQGSTLKFSVALDGDAKIVSMGFDSF